MAFSRGGDMRIARDELETEARRDRDLKQLLPTSIAAALQLAAESIICFSFFSQSDHTEGDPLPDEAVASSGHAPCARHGLWPGRRQPWLPSSSREDHVVGLDLWTEEPSGNWLEATPTFRQVTHSSGTWTLLSIRLEPDAVFRDFESCVGRQWIREALGVEHVREHFDAVDQPRA